MREVQERIRLEGITRHVEQRAVEVKGLRARRNQILADLEASEDQERALQAELDSFGDKALDLTAIGGGQPAVEAQVTRIGRQHARLETELGQARERTAELFASSDGIAKQLYVGSPPLPPPPPPPPARLLPLPRPPHPAAVKLGVRGARWLPHRDGGVEIAHTG